MAYPSTLSAIATPTATSPLNSPSHSSVEGAQNDAITEIQTFIGTLSSAAGTLIYDVRSPDSGGGGHVQAVNKGGTGITTYSKGNILVAQDSSILGKLTVGNDGEFLMANSAMPLGVGWTSVLGDATTLYPYPVNGSNFFYQKVLSSSTLGFVGKVRVSHPIKASVLSFLGGKNTAGGNIYVTLYTESGAQSVFSAQINASLLQIGGFTSVLHYFPSTIALSQGNYYVLVNRDGADNNQVICYGFSSTIGNLGGPNQSILARLDNLDNLSKTQGVVSIISGQPPTSVTATAIGVPLDPDATSANTLYFRLN